MTTQELRLLLEKVGVPANRSLDMAQQLEKRAHQLAEKKNIKAEEALAHLVGLLKQGWAAREKGISP